MMHEIMWSPAARGVGPGGTAIGSATVPGISWTARDGVGMHDS